MRCHTMSFEYWKNGICLYLIKIDLYILSHQDETMNAKETTLNSNLFLGGRIREFHAGKSGFKGCLYQLIIGWGFVKKKFFQFSHIFSHERKWHPGAKYLVIFSSKGNTSKPEKNIIVLLSLYIFWERFVYFSIFEW